MYLLLIVIGGVLLNSSGNEILMLCLLQITSMSTTIYVTSVEKLKELFFRVSCIFLQTSRQFEWVIMSSVMA